MKTRSLFLVSLSALLLSGLGQSVALAAAAAPRAIEITAGDNMKFSLASIEAKPGEVLKITLKNIGTMPKEAMGHNFVILKKGTDVNAFATAATTAKATEYIPESLKGQVLAHTPLLGPRKSAEITFTVPAETGDYPFICSFPAHFMVGMKGVISVK
jgi:azurin